MPPLVTSMIWSSSVTMRTPMTRPVLSVVFMVMMPLPPRCVRRYSSIAGALAVAVLGDGEQRGARLDQVERDDLVALVERHAATPQVPRPIGRTSASPKRIAWPSRGREDDLARAVGQADADHLVALVERDRDDARTARGVDVRHEVGLLHEPAPGGEEEVAALLELAHRQEGRELLVGLQAAAG